MVGRWLVGIEHLCHGILRTRMDCKSCANPGVKRIGIFAPKLVLWYYVEGVVLDAVTLTSG